MAPNRGELVVARLGQGRGPPRRKRGRRPGPRMAPLSPLPSRRCTASWRAATTPPPANERPGPSRWMPPAVPAYCRHARSAEPGCLPASFAMPMPEVKCIILAYRGARPSSSPPSLRSPFARPFASTRVPFSICPWRLGFDRLSSRSSSSPRPGATPGSQTHASYPCPGHSVRRLR